MPPAAPCAKAAPVSASAQVVTRRYRIDCDTLTYELDMATSGTPMTRHLGATLRRVS